MKGIAVGTRRGGRRGTHVGVHRLDLLARRRAEHLDDLDELVDPALTGEERLAEHELGHDAAGRPDVDRGRIVCCAKDELGRAIVARADVRDVWLARDEDLCRAKVNQLEDARRRVDQQVLRLDVAVWQGPDGKRRGGQQPRPGSEGQPRAGQLLPLCSYARSLDGERRDVRQMPTEWM